MDGYGACYACCKEATRLVEVNRHGLCCAVCDNVKCEEKAYADEEW